MPPSNLPSSSLLFIPSENFTHRSLMRTPKILLLDLRTVCFHLLEEKALENDSTLGLSLSPNKVKPDIPTIPQPPPSNPYIERETCIFVDLKASLLFWVMIHFRHCFLSKRSTRITFSIRPDKHDKRKGAHQLPSIPQIIRRT